MHDRRRRAALGFAGLLAAAPTGCEDQGYGLRVAVTVPVAVLADYSEAAPGLLVLEVETAKVGTERRVYGVLCGTETDDLIWEVVLEGRSAAGESQVTAWIDLDATGLPCGPLVGEGPGADGLAAGPEETQASATAFEREGCGPAEETVEVELS